MTMATELDKLAAGWRQRLVRRQESRRLCAEAVRTAACRAAEMLRRDYGVAEVWLFGSLGRGPRHDEFDVDLAVRGLAPERHFAAMARVAEPVGRPVDLVALESCGERLRHAVATAGERIDA